MKQSITILGFLLSLLLFSACDTDILTLENSGIYGVVRDLDTGEPVSYATVYLNGPTAANVNADANGNYRFENIRSGEYVVSAEMERYVTPYFNVSVLANDYALVDMPMEYLAAVSTRVLDFEAGVSTKQIVVTNYLNETVDVKTEEDTPWMFATSTIFNLEPGQSETITVDVNRGFVAPGSTANLIVNLEKDFDFDVLESYVVTVNVLN